jgi:aspartate 1-decarboxylase
LLPIRNTPQYTESELENHAPTIVLVDKQNRTRLKPDPTASAPAR